LETGKSSPEAICLCPMVESKPNGLSPTYCLCSLGYVKEMNEQTFGKPVDAELLDSVLQGAKRCRFKVTVQV
jgi:predicted hydrocarbon binding protein